MIFMIDLPTQKLVFLKNHIFFCLKFSGVVVNTPKHNLSQKKKSKIFFFNLNTCLKIAPLLRVASTRRKKLVYRPFASNEKVWNEISFKVNENFVSFSFALNEIFVWNEVSFNVNENFASFSFTLFVYFVPHFFV